MWVPRNFAKPSFPICVWNDPAVRDSSSPQLILGDLQEDCQDRENQHLTFRNCSSPASCPSSPPTPYPPGTFLCLALVRTFVIHHMVGMAQMTGLGTLHEQEGHIISYKLDREGGELA